MSKFIDATTIYEEIGDDADKAYSDSDYADTDFMDGFCWTINRIQKIPETIVRCKDCIFFEKDLWGVVKGKPVIVSHEVCSRFVEGTKVSPEGFCYLAERRSV